ncbi:discoidin, CUB and LCCL domain-containing protein 1 [Electrophorus electricus]|uniref:discoidin, CUB and LCCL domain-containing protein 1 n=1 Tax=Electrophorus electricus TaxID=8005 RepID=UPI0015D04316|nr:discoidin, CUB and LCCL domain-containing protein 1 [Electrophorus electricus]
MRATPEGVRDAVELFSRVVFIFGIETLMVYGQKGNGCGHTMLSHVSGTMASLNYPGTYPNHTQCEWSVKVPQGFTLLLAFSDFDLEWSQDCRSGSLTILDKHGAVKLGPICGQLATSERNMSMSSNEVTVQFVSGMHRSGRGFLLSYSTNQQPDLISCLHRGSHYTSPQFSVFCPGGCRDVTGEIWGQHEQGYRDTSVLCKAAVHAGVISDSQGGTVTVTQQRGITLYESSFANGVLSRTGSLSDKRLVFNRACDSVLSVMSYNASSTMDEVEALGWSPEHRGFGGQFVQWTSSKHDHQPWLELELHNRSNITGIITKGKTNFYIETYMLMLSKDRKTWRAYKDAFSKVKKVFKAYSDGHTVALNSLVPPAAARYLQLRPLSWHGQASALVQVLGCSSPPVQPRSSVGGSTWVKPLSTQMVLLNHVSTESSVVITSSSSSQPLIWVVGMILGVALCVGCLAVVLVGLVWKRRKGAVHIKKGSLETGSYGFHGKHMPYRDSELISYPMSRTVHSSLPNPPLNDYAEPDVLAGGQKVGITFRPGQDKGYTVPFAFNHYDTPGQLPEYAEPLPPEPEYATPFSEQCSNPCISLQLETLLPHSQLLPGDSSCPEQPQYDCPAHRGLSNGYCAPLLDGTCPSRASAIYAEPQPTKLL